LFIEEASRPFLVSWDQLHQFLQEYLLFIRPFKGILKNNQPNIYFIKKVQEYSAACCGDELDICESMVVKAFKGA